MVFRASKKGYFHSKTIQFSGTSFDPSLLCNKTQWFLELQKRVIFTAKPWSFPGSRQNRSQKYWFHDFLALLQKSTKAIPLALASEVDKIDPRSIDLMSLALAPEVGKIDIRNVDLMTFWSWLQSRQNRFQKCWSNDFLALAPEVDKIIPRSIDLIILLHWL